MGLLRAWKKGVSDLWKVDELSGYWRIKNGKIDWFFTIGSFKLWNPWEGRGLWTFLQKNRPNSVKRKSGESKIPNFALLSFSLIIKLRNEGSFPTPWPHTRVKTQKFLNLNLKISSKKFFYKLSNANLKIVYTALWIQRKTK